MKIPEAERLAIQEVLAYGEAWGYGNLITHLQTAWAARLMRSGISEKGARAATARDGGGYPFQMQADLIERGEWDETGARYVVAEKRRTNRRQDAGRRTEKTRGKTHRDVDGRRLKHARRG